MSFCLAAALTACGGGDDDSSGGAGAGGAASGSGGSGGTSGTSGTSDSSGSGGSGGTNTQGGSGGTTAGMAGKSGGSGGSHAGTGGRGGSGGTGGSTAGSAGDGGPAPSSAWVNATGDLANQPSECGNLTLVSAVPDSDTILAGVALHGLYASNDSGQHWTQLGMGAGSATITNRPSSVVYDPNDPTIFWESGIYHDGGVYKTTDGGQTFQQLGMLTHNDLVSVDFTDPDRKTLLVGGHEQKQTLYLSRDGGQTFDQIGMNLPADSHFSSAPQVLDAQTFLLGACGYGDGQCGVYHSADGGQTWDLATDQPAVQRPLVASDGSIYWPLNNNGGLIRGTSDGTSWTKVADGVVNWNPVELPDGRVMVVKGDHVAVSADQGATWTPVGDTLPFSAFGVTYSVKKKTMYVWQWDCGNIVLPNAIASAGFDYTSQ